MKKRIDNCNNIFASSFNRAIKHMNSVPCAFISSFREYDKDENGDFTVKRSLNKNRKSNKCLEADIRASGLTFIRAQGGYIENKGTEMETTVKEDSFCVINNRFNTRNFIDLMVYLCGKYDQDSILTTIPKQDGDSGAIDVVGYYYDRDGNIVSQFDHATISDAEEYFTNIHGKNFVLSSEYEYHITRYRLNTVNAHIMAVRDFADLYPHLL